MTMESRVFGGVVFSGTYAIYVANPERMVRWTCDVEIDNGNESCPEELWANRQPDARQRHALPPLGDGHLGRELVVLVGPEMSPSEAAEALQMIVDSIRQHGLFLGRDAEGKFAFERINGGRYAEG